MTATLATAATDTTRSRRAHLLALTGLDVLGMILSFGGHDYDVELVDRGRDVALTLYKADDTVIAVRGYGIDQYDVSRFDLPAWQDVHGEPTHTENGLKRADVLAILDETRELPRIA